MAVTEQSTRVSAYGWDGVQGGRSCSSGIAGGLKGHFWLGNAEVGERLSEEVKLELSCKMS